MAGLLLHGQGAAAAGAGAQSAAFAKILVKFHFAVRGRLDGAVGAAQGAQQAAVAALRDERGALAAPGAVFPGQEARLVNRGKGDRLRLKAETFMKARLAHAASLEARASKPACAAIELVASRIMVIYSGFPGMVNFRLSIVSSVS